MGEDMMSVYSDMLDAFKYKEKADVDAIATRSSAMSLPIFPKGHLLSLAKTSRDVFAGEETVLTVNHQISVIGDLNGSLLDLLRIINNFGLPPVSRYIFLGDVVEKGGFSLETLTFVLLMKVLWPQDVFYIRGKNEFDGLTGLQSEIMSLYNDIDVYRAFVDVFTFLPMAAILSNKILCIHGGIGPKFTNIDQLRFMVRPINNFSSEIIKSAVWSDPCESINSYQISTRGVGYLYGIVPVQRFLTESKLSIIICGNEPIQEGSQWKLNSNVLTVFSASNCGNNSKNSSGMVHVTSDGKTRVSTFPSLTRLRRRHAQFLNYESKHGLPCLKNRDKLSKGIAATSSGLINYRPKKMVIRSVSSMGSLIKKPEIALTHVNLTPQRIRIENRMTMIPSSLLACRMSP